MTISEAQRPTLEAHLRTMLPKLRKARGAWSQQQLAERVNNLTGWKWSKYTIAKIEAAEKPRSVSVDELVALAAALGVSPAFLVLPPEDWTEVQLLGTYALAAGPVRRWWQGVFTLPLPRAEDGQGMWLGQMRPEDDAWDDLRMFEQSRPIAERRLHSSQEDDRGLVALFLRAHAYSLVNMLGSGEIEEATELLDKIASSVDEIRTWLATLKQREN